MARKEKVQKKKIEVFVKEIASSVTEYRRKKKCPPHVWYFADLILHWKCEFCPALRHARPKDGYFKDPVEIVETQKD